MSTADTNSGKVFILTSDFDFNKHPSMLMLSNEHEYEKGLKIVAGAEDDHGNTMFIPVLLNADNVKHLLSALKSLGYE